jgi:hypothetical protein
MVIASLSPEEGMTEGNVIIEANDDPVSTAASRAAIERGWRNLNWLSANWPNLLPQARGRFVAVAGLEAHIADSAAAAWDWAKTAHPEDDGAILQYVRPEQGPRIYAHSWPVAEVR